MAVGGKDAVNWGWNDGKGLATIFAGFLIVRFVHCTTSFLSPCLTRLPPSLLASPPSFTCSRSTSCLFARIPFVQVSSLRRSSSSLSPPSLPWSSVRLLYEQVSRQSVDLALVYKGSPTLHLDELAPNIMAAAIVGTSSVIAALSVIFWLPYVYCKTVRNDYSKSHRCPVQSCQELITPSALRFYHFFLGPALWWRPAPADAEGISAVPDYRIRKDEVDHPVPAKPQGRWSWCFRGPMAKLLLDAENLHPSSDDSSADEKQEPTDAPPAASGAPLPAALKDVDAHPIEGEWYRPKNLYIIGRYKSIPWVWFILSHGTKGMLWSLGPLLPP